jgi:KDO2-lipid IV(A) lauroyltransferase
MLQVVLRPLAWLPLRALHGCGAAVGWVVYLFSRGYATRLDQNLRQSGLYRDAQEYRRLRRRAIGEAGKLLLEAPVIWLCRPERVMRLFREVRDCGRLIEARARGRGILLLTPHLGCFEAAGFYFGQTLPLTVLYRPPRLHWLEALLVQGRSRGGTRLATTDLAGVRKLLRALRKGEAVGILPDQAPRFGEGSWAPFFGRPAFTMTLSSRLQRATGAAVFMVFAERLPQGAGYRLHIDPLDETPLDEAAVNRAVERAIRLRPEQYLWGYDRYKRPGGMRKPDEPRTVPEQN